MLTSTLRIKEAFEANDIKGVKVHENDEDGTSWVSVSFSGENAESIGVIFVSSDVNGDEILQLYVPPFCKAIPEDKLDEALRLVNECNENYRFLSFTLDKDNEIRATWDVLLNHTNDIGALALEMLLRAISIVDDAYPSFMKLLWG